VDCQLLRTKLFAYADGELPAEQRATLEAHLQGCADCLHLVELERAFREIYVLPLRPTPVPPAVRERVIRALAPPAAPRPPARRPGRRRAALAAALLVAVLAGGVALGIGWTNRQAAASLLRLADASVEQHRKLARGQLPLDIADVSPREAEQWFGDKLSFHVRLPDLKDENLTFVGGRISHLREFEVAALEYRVDGKNVSLFIMPSEQYHRLGLHAEPKFKMVNRQGYDVIVWTSHGAAYTLVSEIGGRSCTVCHSRHEKLDVGLTPDVHGAQ
jgi:anti-sigma factor (TIGR02949 family)